MKKEIKVLFAAEKNTNNNPLFASSYFITSVEKLSKKNNNDQIVVTNNNYFERDNCVGYEVIINIIYQTEFNEIILIINEIINTIKGKYKNIDVKIEEMPELKISKAKIGQLIELKKIALKVVRNMNKNGLTLWNDYYPAEEFEGLINEGKLYVCEQNNDIIGFFALLDDDESSPNFEWKYKKSLFLEMFAINVDYLHKHYAQRILFDLNEKLKKDGYESLKLIVYDENISAISLYKKVGFKFVKGNYVFINKFRPEEPARNMIGMEYYLTSDK